jgi:hypothetical protein
MLPGFSLNTKEGFFRVIGDLLNKKVMSDICERDGRD